MSAGATRARRVDRSVAEAADRRLTPAEISALEDQRDFLLGSLDDLDAELEAGDVDPADYEALRDDYTARAAQVLRALDVQRARVRSNPGVSWSRRVLWIGGLAVFAVAAGLFLARASGSRGANDTATGDIRLSARSLINEAAAAPPEEAIDLYTEALELQPGDVEALTYRGWNRFLAGDLDAARLDLAEAVAVDASYPDARVFSAITAQRSAEPAAAAEHLVALDGLDPNPMVLQLLGQSRIRQETAWSLFVAGDALAGFELMDSGLAVEPDSAELEAFRAWMQLNVPGATDVIDGGFDRLDRLLADDPDQLEARVYRAIGRAFVRGDTAGAAADLAAFDAADDPPEFLVEIVDESGLRALLDG